MGFIYTKHSTHRMKQRGVRRRELDFALRYGHEVRDGYVLRRKDLDYVDIESSDDFDCRERLRYRSLNVVALRGTVFTCHQPTARRRRFTRQFR